MKFVCFDCEASSTEGSTTAGWPEGMVRPDDQVWVPDPSDNSRWIEATFIGPADPADDIEEPDGVGGVRRRSVGWVRFGNGTTRQEQP
jgi:hypothetical protein